MARAIQHEFDHLDGNLFIDHCRNRFDANNVLSKYNLPPIEEERLIDEPELEESIVQWEKENPQEAEKLRKEIEELENGKQ